MCVCEEGRGRYKCKSSMYRYIMPSYNLLLLVFVEEYNVIACTILPSAVMSSVFTSTVASTGTVSRDSRSREGKSPSAVTVNMTDSVVSLISNVDIKNPTVISAKERTRDMYCICSSQYYICYESVCSPNSMLLVCTEIDQCWVVVTSLSLGLHTTQFRTVVVPSVPYTSH